MISVDKNTLKGRSGKFRVVLKKKLKHNTTVTKPIIRIFVSKKTPTLSQPSSNLRNLLQKYSMDDITKKKSFISVQQRESAIKNRRTSSNSLLNGFTAFRAYYSKNARSYKEQIELSQQLARIWKAETQVQELWSRYVNEYKVSCTSDSFVEWMNTVKGGEKTFSSNIEKGAHFKVNPFLFLVVEDVFNTVTDD